MSQRPGRLWHVIRRALPLVVRIVVAAMITPGWVSVGNAQQSSAADIRAYDIPSGPLTAALNRFADEAGIFLAGNAQLTEGKRTAGLKGRFDVREGLQQLLNGTDLEAVKDDSGGFALRRRTNTGDGARETVADTVPDRPPTHRPTWTRPRPPSRCWETARMNTRQGRCPACDWLRSRSQATCRA